MADLMSILRQAGFTGNGLKMAYAIAMAESGGSARAHNPDVRTGDNSYGLFQINMLGAMGPERRRQYGLSSNEDLYDPLVNAKVAYKMSKGGTSWGPWSTYGSGAYKQYYGGTFNPDTGGTPGGVAGAYGSGSGSSSSIPKAAPMSPQETAESYGFVSSLLNSNSELKALFSKAVSGGWTAQKFQASLRDTNWWKNNGKTARDFLMLQYGDPATAKRQVDAMNLKITTMARGMGSAVDAKGIDNIVSAAVMYGWSDAQIRNEIGRLMVFKPGQRLGEAGDDIDKLNQFSYSMGIQNSDSWYQQWAQKIVRGQATQQDAEDELRRTAKTMFPTWAKQIDAGQTVMDLASPYLQSYATILEVPPGSINLFDPMVKSALQSKDPKTGANVVKPIWQFETDLRSDPRWKATKNAQDSMMQVAHQVLTDFGVKY
jgi:hypothetical protein